MGDPKSERRVIVAVLLTSTLLTMLAISGLIVASADLSNRPIPDLEPEQLVLVEALGTNPLRRPFAAANLVVSSLVLIGSFMLSWRRKLAFWWIKQAVTAKVLWIITSTISVAYHLRVVYPGMQPGEVTGDANVILDEAAFWLVMLAAVSIGLHLGAAWRATRPDIKAFVEGTARA